MNFGSWGTSPGRGKGWRWWPRAGGSGGVAGEGGGTGPLDGTAEGSAGLHGAGRVFLLIFSLFIPPPAPSPTHRKEHFWALPSSRRRNLQGLGGDTGDQAPERAVAALSLIFEGGGGGKPVLWERGK